MAGKFVIEKPIYTNLKRMKPQKLIFAALFLTLLMSCRVPSERHVRPVTAQSPEIVASDNDALAQTTYGKVAGYVDNGIFTFKGIPYAQAQRFMPPEPPQAWTEIRSCRAYGPTCPQDVRAGWQSDQQAFVFNWDDGHPDEDCQRLNIWTPAMKNGKAKPVMVWLHGGGYAAGSGNELPSYDGAALAAKGVVLVSVNHRLNILGFLDLSAFGKKYAASGNAGMLDIVAALEWVRDNIANFGGDPNNITIFGQSGGGGKVSTLLAMPSAQGLFHKAIVQSGSTLTVNDKDYTRQLGVAVMEELGLKSSQIGQINTIPYNQLLAAGTRAIGKVPAPAVGRQGWAPVVDGLALPQHPFSPNAPQQAAHIPMLIGTTQHEFLSSAYVPDVAKMSTDQIRETLATRLGSAEAAQTFIDAVNASYPDAVPLDYLDIDTRFRPNAVKQADLHYRQKGADVYMYLFTWESPVLNGMFRSMHCMELPFVFNNINRCRPMTGGGAEAYALAEKMSDAWVHFAQTGRPQADGLPEWEPYTTPGGATMILDNVCALRYHHDESLLKILN